MTRRRAGDIARWSFTLLAGAIAASWIASAWMYAAWRGQGTDSIAFVLKGRAEFYIAPAHATPGPTLGPPHAGLSAGRADRLWMWDQSWQWLPRFRMGNFGMHAVVPLWAPFLGFTMPAGLLWRARAGRARSDCRGCGYDLRGLAEGAVCPECGKGRGAVGAGAPP
jgi:hypothetical protein